MTPAALLPVPLPGRRHRGLLAMLVALTVLASGGDLRAEDLGLLAARIKRSVVHLELSDAAGEPRGIGTGFIVAPDGRVITNHHVIAGAASAAALLSDGRRLPIRGVLALDTDHDLALLALEGNGFAPLELSSSEGLQVGDEVIVVGSPAGLTGSLSVGVVSALRGESSPDLPASAAAHPRAWALQITAAISPGSSGSPVVARARGTVVGIAVGQRTDGQGLNFAIPAEHARALLASAEAEPRAFPAARTGSSLALNLALSAAFFAAIGLLAWLGPRLRRRLPRATRGAQKR